MIDCSQMEGTVSSARGAIIITKLGHQPSVTPLADVAVMLVGMKVKFSAASIHRLLSQDVAILFCDWRGVPEGGTYPWSSHSRVAARHRCQATMTAPRQKNAWGRIVKAKVLGQSQVLKDHGIQQWRQLSDLARRTRSGDPENIEAQAARLYWQALFGAERFLRSPGTGISIRNAQLDYAYAVLRGHGIRATLSAGLSTAVGVFHRGRSNNFALIDDLIEPFRPAIDDAVAQLGEEDSLENSEIRHYLVAAADRKFLEDGRTISSAFSELAQNFGQYAEGEIDRLQVPHWLGASNG